MLQLFGRDLTQAAIENELTPAFGRDDELRRVIETLIRRTKNNPVLVGEPGVGKTAIAEALAIKIFNREVPGRLIGTTLISLDIGSLIAGTNERGAFEERLRAIINEVIASEGKTILFIDELHMLIGAGAAPGTIDAANLLKPALARGQLRCIGATTFNEYQRHIEKDSALERRFEPIRVEEPNEETTLTILRGLQDKWQTHFGVRISDDALTAAVKLGKRYVSSRFFPDKGIDLIEAACAKVTMQIDGCEAIRKMRDTRKQIELVDILIEHAEQAERTERVECAERGARGERDGRAVARLMELERTLAFHYESLQAQKQEALKIHGRLDMDVVDSASIAAVISEKIGVPISKISQNEGARLLTLESEIGQRMIGQTAAVSAVSRALRRARVGLADVNRPMGSFLFVGPTGVGKTELAKTLASILFDDEKALVRIDMSEYFDRYTVSRLIGAPPGYVGYEEGGQLTETVRRRPYSVILLDEIEKAHRDVHNILLQLLDDGRLTDGKGRVIDFRNTLIIMTSNVGAEHLVRNGEPTPQIQHQMECQKLHGALRLAFRPELLNRIDEIVLFHPLIHSELLQVLDIQVRLLNRKLRSRNLVVEIADAAREFIVNGSFDPANGVRPMKRFLKTHVEDQLATSIICGALARESSNEVPTVITITLANDGAGLQFQIPTGTAEPAVPALPVDPVGPVAPV